MGAYIVFDLIIGVWIFFDARGRKHKKDGFISHIVLTLLFNIIYLPIYFGTRKLKGNEIREGGTAWNVLKNYVFIYTLVMILYSVYTIDQDITTNNILTIPIGQRQLDIGLWADIIKYYLIWLIPTSLGVVIGFCIKKTNDVETIQSAIQNELEIERNETM